MIAKYYVWKYRREMLRQLKERVPGWEISSDSVEYAMTNAVAHQCAGIRCFVIRLKIEGLFGDKRTA